MKKLIKFEKENCTPCTQVQNHLDNTGLEIEIEKINPFDNPKRAGEYKIGSVPTTILIDGEGNELARSIGFKPDELDAMLEM